MVPECMNPEPENTPSSRSHPRRGTHQPPHNAHAPPLPPPPPGHKMACRQKCLALHHCRMECLAMHISVRVSAASAQGLLQYRHCAATTAPRSCCSNCYAEQSHKDSFRSSAVGKQLKQKKSNSLSLAQHHLPALDLFWANFFLWDHDTKSSDVDWHIRDKLKPMPKHGSILLYVHGNQKVR